ncbi:hypothetical protein IWQ47_003820 [Aquimarina sp. EL_43]|uniref:hypothetical protein n=1 Tax=unclassified Aquimarina TaxID=2627091 RepID=UPI0018CA88D1|nr:MULTISPECIES: hypothetical protein [unclassified Aquimarina]MBG6132595.1 hypothetical protein [Aquimarina sp. EL_35]MBG6152726.1 hypothetical protein [Aquimarina sp. EL_32]MBG6170733.1 hypothetical protein [Aquimarina sp. EL_43]
MLKQIKNLEGVETLHKLQQRTIQGGYIPSVREFCSNPSFWLSNYPFLANDPEYTC